MGGEAERMESESARVSEEIDELRREWRAKKRDRRVPGAQPRIDDHDGPVPGAEPEREEAPAPEPGEAHEAGGSEEARDRA